MYMVFREEYLYLHIDIVANYLRFIQNNLLVLDKVGVKGRKRIY